MAVSMYCNDSCLYSIKSELRHHTKEMKHIYHFNEEGDHLDHPHLEASHLGSTDQGNFMNLPDFHRPDQLDHQTLNFYGQQFNSLPTKDHERYNNANYNSPNLQADQLYSNMTRNSVNDINNANDINSYKQDNPTQYNLRELEQQSLNQGSLHFEYEASGLRGSNNVNDHGDLNQNTIASVDTVLDAFEISLSPYSQRSNNEYFPQMSDIRDSGDDASRFTAYVKDEKECGMEEKVGEDEFTYKKIDQEEKPDNSVPWYYAIRESNNKTNNPHMLSTNCSNNGLEQPVCGFEKLDGNRKDGNVEQANKQDHLPLLASDEQWNSYWKRKTEEEQIYLAGVNYQAKQVSVDGKNMRECSICKKRYSYRSDCDFHALDSHIKLNYACLNCGKSYSRRNVVKSHLRSCPVALAHEGGKRNLSAPASYSNHSRLWNEYWSSKTMEATRSLSRLGYSALLRKDAEGKPVRICSLCSKEFKFKSRCDKHAVISHAGIKYKCLGCNKEYTRTNTLQAHVQSCPSMTRADLNHKPLSASYRTIDSDNFIRNKAGSTTHKGDIISSPQDLSYTTLTRVANADNRNQENDPHERVLRSRESNRSLIKEEIAASLERLGYHCIAKKDEQDPNAKPSFVCSICMRPFSCRGECNRHAANVHTGVRYQCPECPKTSSCPGSLRRHIESYHTQQNKHQCPNCPKLFSSVDSMRKHIKMRCKNKPPLK